MKKSLSICPTCGGNLKISQYRCPSCEIDINGEFDGCMFCNLSDEDRYFALVFLQTGGNIRDVERVMGISYPTVKAKLTQLLMALGVREDGEHCCGATIEMKVDVDKDELKAHLKEMKKHLKENIKGHVRQHVHHAVRTGGSKFCFRVGKGSEVGEEFEPDAKAPTKEVVDSVIADLKDGKIDVKAALNKLKAEGGKGEGDSKK